MKKNIGSTDRVVRILIAIIIAGFYFTNQLKGTAAIILLSLAGIFILTSIMNFCPIWYMLKISTLKKEK